MYDPIVLLWDVSKTSAFSRWQNMSHTFALFFIADFYVYYWLIKQMLLLGYNLV